MELDRAQSDDEKSCMQPKESVHGGKFKSCVQHCLSAWHGVKLEHLHLPYSALSFHWFCYQVQLEYVATEPWIIQDTHSVHLCKTLDSAGLYDRFIVAGIL